MSPILVRPVREQLEHDRVIRLLQVKLKRKHDVVANIGEDQTVPVRIGQVQIFPDLVLTSADRGQKLMGTVEVETAESVNHLEAMAQWAHLGRARAPFHLYVPAGCVDIARRLASEERRQRRGDLELPHDRRPDPLHAGPPDARSRAAPGRRAAKGGGRSESNRGGENRGQDGRGETAGQARKPAAAAAAPRKAAAKTTRASGAKRATPTAKLARSAEEEVSLPLLRFTRDKRGYENTFVVHTPRRRARSRTRILYWFRTPPGVRVGRAALDEDTIRLLEDHHPDIQFDWPQILRGDEEKEPAPAAAASTAGRAVRPDQPRACPARIGGALPPARPLWGAHGGDHAARDRPRTAGAAAGRVRAPQPRYLGDG